jgi:hypothetical protein
MKVKKERFKIAVNRKEGKKNQRGDTPTLKKTKNRLRRVLNKSERLRIILNNGKCQMCILQSALSQSAPEAEN